MPANSPRPLRIACLHGYCQNGPVFRRKTSSLRKALERPVSSVRAYVSPSGKSSSNGRFPNPSEEGHLAELFFLDAPFVLEPPDPLNPSAPRTSLLQPAALPATERPDAREQRSWWQAKDNGKQYVGWNESQQALSDAFARHNFDGVLGFSQGAVLTGVLCGLASASRVNSAIPASNSNRDETEATKDPVTSITAFNSLRCAVLVSGFPSRAAVHAPLFSQPISGVQSLHVWGTEDDAVRPEYSQALYDRFDPVGRSLFTHEKGHLVPGDAAGRKAISEFFLGVWDRMNDQGNEKVDEASL